MDFAELDWCVVFAYMAGIIAFGVWMGRGQHDTRSYFLGNRTLPWWGVGLSIVATETSALTFIGVPALAYGGDLAFIQIVAGYVIARVLLAVYFVPHYFKGDIYSPYQLFGDAFGPGARRAAGGLFLLSGALAAGVRVYVTAIPIQLLFQFGITEAVLLFVGLSFVYTFAGGIRSVVWTDAIQFGLFVFGGVFVVFFIPTLVDGGFPAMWRMAASEGKTEWLNWTPGLSLPPYNIWMGLVGATFLGLASHGADQLIVQRVLACRSVKDGRKALLLSAAIIVPMFLTFLVVGVLLWSYYQTTAPAIPIPTDQEGISRNDYVFPIFILSVVPVFLKGLLVVAIFSAAMSSVSSALSALASVSTMDFARPLLKDRVSESGYLWLSRWMTLGWAVILILIALASQRAAYVLNLAFSLSGLTNGAILGGLFLVLWRRHGPGSAVILGMAASLSFMAVLHFGPKVAEEAWARWIGVSVGWPWYTLIGTAVALGVAEATRRLLPGRGSRAGKT